MISRRESHQRDDFGYLAATKTLLKNPLHLCEICLEVSGSCLKLSPNRSPLVRGDWRSGNSWASAPGGLQLARLAPAGAVVEGDLMGQMQKSRTDSES